MGFPMRRFALLFSLVLVACGGGGSSNTPAVLSYFTEVNSGISLSIPYQQSEVTSIQTIDINNDGKNDIVLHIWSKETTLGITDTTVTSNKLLLLIQQSDGTFLDQTSTYLLGSNDLGGIVGDFVVGDFNKDGKVDVVYAVSQENGRSSSNPNDMNAQLAALVSVGSKYTITKFGLYDWYSSVGTLIDNGNTLVTGKGYNNNYNGLTYAYNFNIDGSVNTYNITLSYISPASFQFFQTNTDSDVLLEGSSIDTRLGVIDAYVKNNNVWNKVDSYQVADLAGYLNLNVWNGNSENGDPVYSVNGINTTLHMANSCKLKPNPNSSTIALFSFQGLQIKNFTSNMLATELQQTPYNYFVGVSFDGNHIVKSNINIPSNTIDISRMECKDINNDGYDDVVFYPISNVGLPYVYLNDHNNNFVQVNQSVFPSNTLMQVNGYSSVLFDYNNDGLQDLFVLPVDYGMGSTISYKFYRGNVVLK